MQPKRQAGMTLIELVVTVTIISILTVIAVPSYLKHTQRSHRNDAMSALLRIAAEQEKFYFQNSRYGTLAELGSPATEHGWYDLAISDADANTFTATATANETGPQYGDEDCRLFRITAAGVRSAQKADTADSDRCWR